MTDGVCLPQTFLQTQSWWNPSWTEGGLPVDLMILHIRFHTESLLYIPDVPSTHRPEKHAAPHFLHFTDQTVLKHTTDDF